jgi:hypothetical protein
MARLYHVDIARHVTSASHKWVDNLLSHFSIPGVEGGRRGSARRISAEGISHIALVRRLTEDLHLAVADAVTLANRLMHARSLPVPIGGGLEVRLDLEEFRTKVERAIADGVESVIPARRGRPRKQVNPLP